MPVWRRCITRFPNTNCSENPFGGGFRCPRPGRLRGVAEAVVAGVPLLSYMEVGYGSLMTISSSLSSVSRLPVQADAPEAWPFCIEARSIFAVLDGDPPIETMAEAGGRGYFRPDGSFLVLIYNTGLPFIYIILNCSFIMHALLSI